jgi:hypothetical protein
MMFAFGQQLTALADKFGVLGVFEKKRMVNGAQKSTISFSVCEPLAPSYGCGDQASCCELFQDGKVRQCGTWMGTESASFVFDRFLKFEEKGAAFVAGITLRYNVSNTLKVPSNSFGLKPPAGMPEEVPLGFEFDVKCNPLVDYLTVPGIDAVYSDNSIYYRVKAESQYGCVATTGTFLHLTSWKILFYILAPVAMLAGLILCFLGWRLFRITSLMLGLFFGLTIAGMVILISVFLACEATKPENVADFWNWSHECTFHYLTSNAYVGWVTSMSGLLFGLILAIVAYRKPSFGGVLIGMSVGAWVSDFLYMTTFSVLKQHWIVFVLSMLFIPLFAIMGSCLPNRWKRSFFIIVISFTGAYLFCWGVGAYTQYFPSMTLLNDLGPQWQYIVFAIIILLLGVLGSIVQFNVTGAFDWDTLMESGLCPGKGSKGRRGKQGESLLSATDQEIEMDAKTKSIINEINDVENDI